MRHKFKSLKEETLRVYLNRTSAQHNGLNHATYTNMKQLGVSKAEIARRFGVSWDTINRWNRLDETERKLS